MKKLIINEDQMKLFILNEMAYPESFNIEFFKNIKSFRDRVKYCNQHLERLGNGSSRIVYKIDDDKALKLAKNNKGIGQNESESDYYKSSLYITANVIDFDENYLWLESELARKCKINDFKKILGYDFDFVKLWVQNIANEYSRQPRKIENFNIVVNGQHTTTNEIFELFYNEEGHNWEWFDVLSSYLRDYTLNEIGDLLRISSWGIVIRNGQEEIVLIDSGLDEQVWKDYYSK